MSNGKKLRIYYIWPDISNRFQLHTCVGANFSFCQILSQVPSVLSASFMLDNVEG